MTLHEISTGDNLVWVLDEDSGQATKTICEETGAQFRGAKTYQQWMPHVDRCLISLIDYDGPADAWFPSIIPGMQP